VTTNAESARRFIAAIVAGLSPGGATAAVKGANPPPVATPVRSRPARPAKAPRAFARRSEAGGRTPSGCRPLPALNRIALGVVADPVPEDDLDVFDVSMRLAGFPLMTTRSAAFQPRRCRRDRFAEILRRIFGGMVDRCTGGTPPPPAVEFALVAKPATTPPPVGMRRPAAARRPATKAFRTGSFEYRRLRRSVLHSACQKALGRSARAATAGGAGRRVKAHRAGAFCRVGRR